MELLTPMQGSPKLAKYTGDAYEAAILYLASAVYRKELCPNAGACMKACLIVKAGRGAFDSKVGAARKRKSDWLLSDRVGFVAQLRKDMDALIRRAAKLGKRPAVRLNGGSDLDWSDLYAEYKDRVTFWEYTKRPDLALKLHAAGISVTYSYSERTTDRLMNAMLERGINVAMVFNLPRKQSLPLSMHGREVVNGDLHDFRFLDPVGVIVGLRLKSNRRVTSEQVSGGFVQTTNEETSNAA